MANWQRELNLTPEWNDCSNHKISLNKLAKVISDKLSKINQFRASPSVEDEKNNLIDKFNYLSNQDDLSVDEFDSLMSELYNWGDFILNNKFPTKKVCWIKTQ